MTHESMHKGKITRADNISQPMPTQTVFRTHRRTLNRRKENPMNIYSHLLAPALDGGSVRICVIMLLG